MARQLVLGLARGVLLELLDRTPPWLDDQTRSRQKAKAEAQARIDEVTRRRVEQSCAASDAAVEQGRLLLEARLLHGSLGWPALVESMGIRVRTAQNLMAVAILAKMASDLYLRFRVLGPTKLYRLARLGPEKLKGLTLETDVATPRGTVKLGQLSDRELQAYLRILAPAHTRPAILRAVSMILSAVRIVEQAETVSVGAAALVETVVLCAVERLNAKVGRSGTKDSAGGQPIRESVG